MRSSSGQYLPLSLIGGCGVNPVGDLGYSDLYICNSPSNPPAKENKMYNYYARIYRDGRIFGYNGTPVDPKLSHYDRRLVARYFRDWPNCHTVTLATPRHNNNTARYLPQEGEIIYVKSTSGKYGKSARVRFGHLVLTLWYLFANGQGVQS